MREVYRNTRKLQEQRWFLQKVLLQTKLWKMDSLKHYQVEVVWVKWRIQENLISRMEKPPPGVILCLLKSNHLKEHLHLTVIMALWQNWVNIRLRRQAWGLRIMQWKWIWEVALVTKARRRTEIHLQKKKVNYLILPVVLNRMYLVA